MGRTFPCVMKVVFKANLGLPPLNLNYYVSDEPVRRRVVVQLSKSEYQSREENRKFTKKSKGIELDVDPPVNVWVRLGEGAMAAEVLTLRPRPKC